MVRMGKGRRWAGCALRRGCPGGGRALSQSAGCASAARGQAHAREGLAHLGFIFMRFTGLCCTLAPGSCSEA